MFIFFKLKFIFIFDSNIGFSVGLLGWNGHGFRLRLEDGIQVLYLRLQIEVVSLLIVDGASVVKFVLDAAAIFILHPGEVDSQVFGEVLFFSVKLLDRLFE